MRWIAMLTLCVCCATVTACGDDDAEEEDEGSEELPEVDCSKDVPTYAQVAAIEICTNCHSSELSGAARNNAPADDNFDTYAGAEEKATEMVEEVFGGDMPPKGTFTLTDAQKQELYLWALCGAME